MTQGSAATAKFIANTSRCLRYALLIATHLFALLACRVHVFLRGVPVPREMAPSSEQMRLILKRLWLLRPWVHVPKYDRVYVRLGRAIAGFARTLADTPAMFLRKSENNDTDFTPALRQSMEGYPNYYCKNYHHQTDGYFTYASARRYDVQYELVFYGLGQDVREVSASQLRRFLPECYRGSMLELGSGTAQLGIAMHMLFPHSKILITDPSIPYLEYAIKKYPCLKARMQPTFAEDLRLFADASFGVVFSGFIYHEMPADVVKRSLREAMRVLEPGGFMLVADSSQDSDGPDNLFALDQFQKTFHEPYYQEFRAGNLATDIAEAGLLIRYTGIVYFTKCIIAQKPV